MLRTASVAFHPVIHLPDELEIYDFSAGYDPDRVLTHAYGIGKYDELRPGMYKGEQFGGVRNIHVGIDIGCPAGEPVYAFFAGTIHKLGQMLLDWLRRAAARLRAWSDESGLTRRAASAWRRSGIPSRLEKARRRAQPDVEAAVLGLSVMMAAQCIMACNFLCIAARTQPG